MYKSYLSSIHLVRVCKNKYHKISHVCLMDLLTLCLIVMQEGSAIWTYQNIVFRMLATCFMYLTDSWFKHLELYFSQRGFVLLRPPKIPAGMKLSKTEVKQTKQIASLRIQVERVIRRLREFSQHLELHSVIIWNLIGMMDLWIWTALCVHKLTRFSN